MLIIGVGGAGTALSQTNQAPEKAPAAERPAVWGKPTETPNDSLISPEVAPNGRVTFQIYAPEAKNMSLRVNCDFPGVSHDCSTWRVCLNCFAPLLFL
jgi:hypothetical protein